MSFKKRALKITITLGTGNYGTSGANTLTVEGLRISADIQMTGGQSFAQATLRIFGMRQSDMNQLTVLSFGVRAIVRNSIKIEADGATVFEGDILNAWADYQNSPDVCMYVDAQSAFYDQIAPVAPISIKGGADVASIMRQLAGQMGLAFENAGVAVSVSDQYLAGTRADQVRTLAKIAGIDFYLENGVLAICPRGQARPGTTPELGPGSGLIGYPTFDRFGIALQAEFNPAFKFGGTIKIDSDVIQARGTWKITGLSMQLESQRPGGAWFSNIRCSETGLTPIKQ